MRQLREYISIPKWILVTKYAMFALLGVIVVRSGSSSIEQATSHTYLFWYGVALAAASVVALVGSVVRNWVEMIGALLVWSLMLVYVGATAARALGGHTGTQSISVVLLIVSLLPAVRGFGLLINIIRTRVKHVA